MVGFVGGFVGGLVGGLVGGYLLQSTESGQAQTGPRGGWYLQSKLRAPLCPQVPGGQAGQVCRQAPEGVHCQYLLQSEQGGADICCHEEWTGVHCTLCPLPLTVLMYVVELSEVREEVLAVRHEAPVIRTVGIERRRGAGQQPGLSLALLAQAGREEDGGH